MANKKKKRKIKYGRAGVATIEEVNEAIYKGKRSGTKFMTIKGIEVRWSSSRYRLFEKNHVCVECGCEGEFYVIERNGKDKNGNFAGPYHLNLYSIVEGRLMMMTKDHIVPKSKGGLNNMTNYQTMCISCNSKKADIYKG